MNSSLSDLVYIFDEQSVVLHLDNMQKLMTYHLEKLAKCLMKKGNKLTIDNVGVYSLNFSNYIKNEIRQLKLSYLIILSLLQ